MDIDQEDIIAGIDTTAPEGALKVALEDIGVSFRSDTGAVNMEERTVSGIVLTRTGEARGHGVHIEQEFITDMYSYVRKAGGEIKCNFNHNWDNMGLQLGRFNNVRIENDQIRADLLVYRSADDSPRMPLMGSWFLGLAKEDPAALACSIRFQPKHYYQYNDTGKKVVMKNYSWYTGQFANQDPEKKLFVKFHKLISADIVAEGAVTDALFHNKSQHAMSTESTQDTNPAIAQLTQQVTDLTAQMTALQSASQEDKTTNEALTKQVADLTAELTALKESAAAEHTRGAGAETGGAVAQERKYSSVTQSAIEMYERRQKAKAVTQPTA